MGGFFDSVVDFVKGAFDLIGDLEEGLVKIVYDVATFQL